MKRLLIVGLLLSGMGLVEAAEDQWVSYNLANWKQMCAHAPFEGELPPQALQILEAEHWTNPALGRYPKAVPVNNTCLALGLMPKADGLDLPLPEAKEERPRKR